MLQRQVIVMIRLPFNFSHFVFEPVYLPKVEFDGFGSRFEFGFRLGFG